MTMLKLTTLKRRLLLAAGLAILTVVVLWWGGGSEPGSARSREEPATQVVEESGRPLPEVDLGRLEQKPDRDAVGDAFEPRSWAPVAEPRKGPPPPPQAPPLPFHYIGKIIETEGRVTVFIGNQSRNYVVHEGDTIDNTYHVDAVGADVVKLTYLPLNIQQALPIGSAR
ncbi:MAG TPA: hypothetical protein VMT94_05230 [Burkholderiales bacterium]|nr:hypothetical protein [Burkholderiales bacterium]